MNGHTIYDQRFVDQGLLQWYHEIYHALSFLSEALFRMSSSLLEQGNDGTQTKLTALSCLIDQNTCGNTTDPSETIQHHITWLQVDLCPDQ